MAEDRRQSPLVECTISDQESEIVKLGERPFLGHLNFRANSSDTDALKVVEEMFGLNLPLQPNQMVRSGAGIAIWLRRDEWLLIHQDETGGETVEPLRAQFENRHATVVDVSSAQTLIYLYGTHSREVLARGCPLDLHPRSFKPGDSAQTHFEHIPITLWLDTSTPDPESKPWINVVVRRSFADFLWRRFEDSAKSLHQQLGADG